MPGTVLPEAEWEKCINAIKNIPRAGFVVASGSLPPEFLQTFTGNLAAVARARNLSWILQEML